MEPPRAGVQSTEVEAFAAAIEQRFGHQQDARRADELRTLLERRMEATGSAGYAGYGRLLEHSREEWEALAPLLTVPETYFFRMPEHFTALVENVLPKVIEANRGRRTLRILSAGCASGEEAYTLRMLLEERFPELRAGPQAQGWSVEIQGVDLSEAALARARAGVYNEWSLRATSEARRLANFVRVGKQWKVADRLRAGVSFRRENLLAAAPAAEAPWDVIFCRNVLIYFSEGAMLEAIGRLTQRLAPHGYLFLGPAESLRGVSRDFHLCHWGNVFFYKRKEQVGAVRTREAGAASPAVAAAKQAGTKGRGEAPGDLAGAGFAPAGNDSWYEAIRHSSERLAGLVPGTTGAATERVGNRASSLPGRAALPAGRPGLPAGLGSAALPVGLAAKMPGILELVRGEKFGEALHLLESGGQDANAEGVRLLRASMLASLGRHAEAEAECRQLLLADELNAGAHFVLGLCREQGNELPEAEKQMRAATYLDPGFTMAHVHLGLVARRRGDRQAAAVAFRLGLRTVETEDAGRLALFGGGFSREALRQTCLRELERLDGKAAGA